MMDETRSEQTGRLRAEDEYNSQRAVCEALLLKGIEIPCNVTMCKT